MLRRGGSGRFGPSEALVVEPHALVLLGGRWYLAAFDLDRDAWRSFRVDRLDRPAPTGARFTAREVPGGDAARFVAANLWSAPHRYEALLTLHASAER